jgi:hypothetical protein
MMLMGVLLMIGSLIYAGYLGINNKTKAKIVVKWGQKDPSYIFKLFNIKSLLIITSFWVGLLLVIINFKYWI